MAGYRSLEIVPREIFVVGREAALVWTINATTTAGSVTFDGVDVFRFDNDGRITNVRALWERGPLHMQLQRLRGTAEG